MFVEVTGQFGGLPVQRGLQPVADNVLATYRFATERALNFIASFDQRQEAQVEGVLARFEGHWPFYGAPAIT